MLIDKFFYSLEESELFQFEPNSWTWDEKNQGIMSFGVH